jgi:hypothetical protein
MVMDIVVARLLPLLETSAFSVHFSTLVWILALCAWFLETYSDGMHIDEWLDFNARSYLLREQAGDLREYEEKFIRVFPPEREWYLVGKLGKEVYCSKAVWIMRDEDGEVIEKCFLETDGRSDGRTKRVLNLGTEIRVTDFLGGGDVFEIVLKQNSPGSVTGVEYDEDNCRIIYRDRHEREVEVILSFEGRVVEAAQDAETDREENDDSTV